jgi:phosphatidylinositol kinase/protein kinase (PI-3  family)
LEYNLSIFVRDEVLTWNVIAQAKLMSEDFNISEVISKNIDVVVRKSRLLACEMERKTVGSFLYYLSKCVFFLFETIADHLPPCQNNNNNQIDPSNPQPVCQSIIELINLASSLPKLYSMDPTWMPWL